MELYMVANIKGAEVFRVSPHAEYFCIGGAPGSCALKMYADSLWISEYHAPQKCTRRVRKKLRVAHTYKYYRSIEDLLSDFQDPLPPETELEGWCVVHNVHTDSNCAGTHYLKLRIPAQAQRTSWVFKGYKHRCDLAQVAEIWKVEYLYLIPCDSMYVHFEYGREPVKISTGDMIYASEYDADRTCSYDTGIVFYDDWKIARNMDVSYLDIRGGGADG